MASEDPFEIIDDTEALEYERPERYREHEDNPEDDHLNARHIKAILAEKKALYRHGTYMTIIAVAMVVVAVQLVYMAAADFHSRSAMRTGAFVVIAAGLALFAVHFVRRSLQLRREAAATLLPAATREPDFSSLSDGSQFEENLKHMHER